MKNKKTIYKKVGTNFQVTLPNEFRQIWKLQAGSLVKMHMDEDRLIIEQAIDNKDKAMAKLEAIFGELAEQPALGNDEDEIMQIVDNEIKASDEREYITEAVNFLNSKGNNINLHTVETTADLIIDNFEKTVWHCEYPIVDFPAIACIQLNKLIRDNNYKVVMGGQGVVEFVAKIPSKLKIKGSREKYLLYEAFKNDIPEKIYKRKKHAFLTSSIVSDKFFNFISDIVNDSKFKDVPIFHQEKVKALLKLDKEQRNKHYPAFMAIANGYFLHKNFIG